MKFGVRVVTFATALLFSSFVLGLEVTQFEGAARGFPALLDASGKKLAEGGFFQWLEGELLRVRIIYRFKAGDRIEENAAFRQRLELSQQEWLWREVRGGELEREFAVNFTSHTATAQKRDKGEMKKWSEQVDIQPGRTFAGFGFTLALQNLRKRLVSGEHIELAAVAFTPKPRTIGVELTYGGTDEMKMCDRMLEGERFVIHPKIPAIAQVFVHVPDTHIWLTKPPSGFLRWEGPMAEPSDAIVRVDLVGGAESGPARPAQDVHEPASDASNEKK